MKLSNAINGFLLFKSSEGLSPRTVQLYRYHLESWQAWTGDVELAAVTSLDIVRYLEYLRHEYEPQRLNGEPGALSSQTLRNIWVALRSFWRWADEVLEVPSPMRRIKAPKASNAETAPLTQQEVKAILAATQPKRAARPRSGARYEQQLRDRAIVLLLLDTGLRASELCSLKIGDVELRTGRVSVAGKGGKHRYVWAASVTRQALWQYLSERIDGGDPAPPLFTSTTGARGIGRRWLSRHVKQLGERAGVEGVYPHRFRHTFAVQYLRNGGDVFTLQILLGHSSLKMVRHYARLADVDTARVHAQASPVDGWLK